MSSFIDYLMVDKDFVTNVSLGEDFSEIENDSYSYIGAEDVYGFQVSKLRNNNIPPKKK